MSKIVSLVPGTGIEPVHLAAANFKSATSTNFVTRAGGRDHSPGRSPFLNLGYLVRTRIQSNEYPA
jgi:hypothetical protein